MAIDMLERPLNEPKDKKLTFDQAVERARFEVLDHGDGEIVCLQLHCNGTWMVRWLPE